VLRPIATSGAYKSHHHPAARYISIFCGIVFHLLPCLLYQPSSLDNPMVMSIPTSFSFVDFSIAHALQPQLSVFASPKNSNRKAENLPQLLTVAIKNLLDQLGLP